MSESRPEAGCTGRPETPSWVTRSPSASFTRMPGDVLQCHVGHGNAGSQEAKAVHVGG